VRAKYLCCHSLAGSIYEEQIMLLIMIRLIKYRCVKKEVKLGLLLLLFHPFLSPGHACIAKLDRLGPSGLGKLYG